MYTNLRIRIDAKSLVAHAHQSHRRWREDATQERSRLLRRSIKDDISIEYHEISHIFTMPMAGNLNTLYNTSLT